ncbi:hypothetical protein [Haladaptatus sp. ZSTT2]|uniref:hypothetical protein n=1 Tax=Haladaptatus sp. ZSTT2 TaxID=3120515 RepID=UPI00300EF64D
MTTLTQYLIGFLLAAHGWVHFVYVASSLGWFASESDWAWNGRSWLLSEVLEETQIRTFANGLFLLVALGFVIGALGYVFAQNWWRPLLIAASVLSTALYLLLWDGKATQLPEKGGLGILINVAVIAWIVVLN